MGGDPLGGQVADAAGQGPPGLAFVNYVPCVGAATSDCLSSGARTPWATPPPCRGRSSSSGSASETLGHLATPKTTLQLVPIGARPAFLQDYLAQKQL